MVTTSLQSDWSLMDLNDLLMAEEWQAADKVTQSLLLDAVGQPENSSLSPEAIAQIPCQTLHSINHLWVEASRGQFGFSVQQQLYQALSPEFDTTDVFNPFNPHPFCQAVGWLMVGFPRPLAFFKFYNFLTFSLDAPPGHLPALWYWQLAWQDSWRVGGFGTGRGAGFADVAMLDAMMLRLSRCSQI
ncbi:GUN4 domain-containing protein [Nodosilinea sp. P-1105]|uniref:GUN4 domain-containing protein n=1 Tax=Nodosilinea sp. P-1105 TaxID=2546229 RepID=UPI00146B1404|nr:GUN4 domain-containing protein [Nodosilinea sp. P-1105]NMF83081.1 GUN4 domain-containing protein [Nodosilinea sp. P-1105]